MVKLKELNQVLESIAPLSLQEDYDNSGLIVSTGETDINKILITLDVTEAVVDEAIRTGSNMIVAHHPVIFRGLKKINGSTDSGRAILKAVTNKVHIYAIHTNLDNTLDGVNGYIADKLGMNNKKVLLPKENLTGKLVTFCPSENTPKVLAALYEAGAGIIGNYEHCSFRSTGKGSYRPNENAKPYIGTPGKDAETSEERLELQFPLWKEKEIMEALIKAHPYEEVAYYIQRVNNVSDQIGSGLTGHLQKPVSPDEFLNMLKVKLELNVVKYTLVDSKKKINKVALCGGSGSFLIQAAISAQVDALITADIKYHEFFQSEGILMLADIGHYESEKFTKDLLYNLINKKISNIALHLSEVNTNPVHYL